MNDIGDSHPEFLDVTEVAGQDASEEQFQRLCGRYYWAAEFCENKDVLEIACGSAAGLGYLQSKGARVIGTDISAAVLAEAKSHYGNRFSLLVMDAQSMDFPENSQDVIIIFEALYYLPAPEKFVMECRRVLRANGKVLVCTANKDLYDFNPSPYSHHYYGVIELAELFGKFGFETEFWGAGKMSEISVKQKLLRPIKLIAAKYGLIPKTMIGKRFLKKIIFGKMTKIPPEITDNMVDREALACLPSNRPDREHKVVHCVAALDVELT